MPDLSLAYVRPWFWEIVDGAKFNMNTLVERLGLLSTSELIEFLYQFRKAEAMLAYDEDFLPYLPWASEDMGLDFANWLVGLGRAVWEAVQNDPEAVQPYANLFWEGKEDTLPVWTREGKSCDSPDSYARDILEDRGIDDEQIYNLLDERDKAGPSEGV